MRVGVLAVLAITGLGVCDRSLAYSPAQYTMLKANVSDWNSWRAKNPRETIDLSGANLTGAGLVGANLSGANLSGATLSKVNLSGASLDGANLAGANLDRVDFTKASLIKASFADGVLSRSSFSMAKMSGVDLSGAKVTSTDFCGAAMVNAKFDGDTRLAQVDFSSADLSRAAMHSFQNTDCIYDAKTRFPDGFNPAKCNFRKR